MISLGALILSFVQEQKTDKDLHLKRNIVLHQHLSLNLVLNFMPLDSVMTAHNKYADLIFS